MMFSKKNILLISPEPWNHIFVSKHHYAIQLAHRGSKVFFLNPPGTNDKISITDFKNVFEVNYRRFPPGLRFYPTPVQRSLIYSAFRRLEALCSVQFDVIWSFDNSVFYDFSALPDYILKISHIVDFNQSFQTKKAAATADYCFCVSEAIRSTLLKYRKVVYKINHGFHPSGNRPALLLPKFWGKFRAVYAGNLSIPYIDWSLFENVVQRYPEVDFLFVGPCENSPSVKERLNILSKNRNVFLIGRVNSSQLPAYYHMADILLVNYQQRFHSDQATNSHKIMEYLGSGKVVVATKTLEYSGFYPLIVMSENNFEWLDLFGDVLSRLSYFNSDELKGQRISFAMNHTYAAQIEKIEQIISQR